MASQGDTVIFPSQTNDLKTVLTELKRSNLRITNRLHSIHADATFVASVAKAFHPLPLIANERCGSWYIPSSPGSANQGSASSTASTPTPSDSCRKAGSAYFKSTDGHHGEWSFSLRRLNLQILDLVGEGGGCIIVDSTRRGKSMPDALSKTIPIWICVLNRLLFPSSSSFTSAAHDLHTPETLISPSEHSQILARIPSFVTALQTLHLDIPSLREKLKGKPLRPFFVTPSSDLISIAEEVREETNQDANSYHPIILCTASSRESEEEASHHVSGYVQGAADDAEAWALGLDAQGFWENCEELLRSSEDELPEVIGRIVAERKAEGRNGKGGRRPTWVDPCGNLAVASNAAVDEEGASGDFDLVVSCSGVASFALEERWKKRYIRLPISSSGKLGSRQLRNELPKLEQLRSLLRPESRLLVTCETGKDLSVGVALALICLFYDSSGSLIIPADDERSENQVLNKEVIRQRLAWIMVSMPDASPSRATLQSVNAFLLG
ncbi:tRNA '-O-ribosylphosphate transferase [Hortaea werneckii]|uniref:Initiator tRNA phosphoribosyl transferase n=1 Tax=Hortaea werneckii TaxID=91943 RepID=A0A3M7F5C8_HORWE|nr:tRNA '-O-ribosylphosphate transferase [Hortaea werneckii]KAI7624863.1 tRNA '-O-ribosylphosphate transferase [Hortaea werneckii]KAI7630104.1 tRNA '-O-ribosylphosphate transferase [Hortaea werneckii]KAI7679454.1 tRNA '-O-ribosylphosphate transferase [Hortaea werneckii]KAI7714601.1 tRNA '-O-ribosylphosphate transferase [Hortaea werneckii]